jgi:hypothetical protein
MEYTWMLTDKVVTTYYDRDGIERVWNIKSVNRNKELPDLDIEDYEFSEIEENYTYIEDDLTWFY